MPHLSLNSLGISTASAIGSVIKPGPGINSCTIMPPLKQAHYWDPPSLINRHHLVIMLIKMQINNS